MHTRYDVNDSTNEVKLNLKVGFGQKAVTIIFLNGIMLKQLEDNISDFKIGVNKDLKGKSMSIYTNVLDINPNTNQTSVEFFLEGGEGPLNCPPILQQVSNGGVAYFDIVVNFF